MCITVQVLLSSYNGEKYIEEQIESILNQEGINVKLLVRDDFSTDDTRKILSSLEVIHKNIKVIYGEANIGYEQSFFELIKNTDTADFYSFSDQDDYWESDKILKGINYIKHSNNMNKPMGYCSNLKVVDNNLKFKNMLFSDNIIPNYTNKLIVKGFAYGCTIILNDLAANIIKKNKELKSYPFDFWMPMLIKFCGDFLYDNDSRIMYRQHESNVIGEKQSITKIIKKKKKQLAIKNYYSNIARLILKNNEKDLDEKHKNNLRIISDYQISLKFKYKLFFDKKLTRDTIKGTVFIKYLIITNQF